MRTTITLDDDTAALVKEHMRRRGAGLKQVVNDALREALSDGPSEERFVVQTYDMGPSSVPLDRALALAADLEDEEILRKMALRK